MREASLQTRSRPPVAVLFGALDGRHDPEHALDELAGLAEAADVGVAGRLTQRLERPHPATYIGAGKVTELKALCSAVDADVVLADMDLSPAQVRNLTKAVGVRVVDRSELIMDIFARRARTAQAKLQVELAQLQYALPRLRGQWAHLDRYRGGGVGTRGPGEKQLETDRRLVRRRIGDLQNRLAVYERRTKLGIEGRSDVRKAALVGYTNTGKSTLFNRLTGADVYAANRLFATLDTRTRRWPIADCDDVVLSDTVGFVRDLPHHLVASFHATLEEVVEADLVLHVVDASAPNAAECIAAVGQTLQEIGARDVPALMVFNKIDLVRDRLELQALLNAHPGAVPVSARTGEGLQGLADAVRRWFSGRNHEFRLALPFDRGGVLARLGRLARVLANDPRDDAMHLRLSVDDGRLQKLRALCQREGLTLDGPLGAGLALRENGHRR